jgi:GH15 family glucan-1,4-alpha-glucosidase
MAQPSAYPPLADYSLIGDCNTAALVSGTGSIDWCCVPRFDAGSCFGRLIDWEHGGFFAIEPRGAATCSRAYLDETLVLATTFRVGRGEARLIDCFRMPPADTQGDSSRELLRVVEGHRGAVDFVLRFAPRFDYGEVEPWIRGHGLGLFSATGGNDGLVLWSEAKIEASPDGSELRGGFRVTAGDRVRTLMRFLRPERIESDKLEGANRGSVDRSLEETLEWWRRWSANLRLDGPDARGVRRSALVLKALTYKPTGAMLAAATTSLPESPQGERTWDYRYSWVRDSALAARSLALLGCEPEADAFRRFIERTAAGHAKDLRIAYGIGGERHLDESELQRLEGWRGARPVRVGNAAAGQTQLDAYGQLVDQSWRWHRRGHSPDDDYWRFLHELVESAIERWREPDAGIWEWRGKPKHFVHSKVLCWTAVDRGLALAEECARKAPHARWRRARDEIREAIETEGYDSRRGVFVQAFDSSELDAALLRLPTVGFVDYRDHRMVRTADAIREELSCGAGLLRRYRGDDGLPGREGAFLPCSFWLAEVLARQERYADARQTFDQAIATANGLGLFSEEFDPEAEEMLGNFPQALTHLSHIEAALALAEHLPRV